MTLWYILPTITNGEETDSFLGEFGRGKLRNSWADVSWVAGDRYYQAAGTTFTTAVGGPGRIGINASGTAAARIYIGKFGGSARPIIEDWSDAFFNLQGRQYVDVEDFEVIAKNGASSAYGANCYGSASAQAKSLAVRRCKFTGQYVSALWCYATAIDQLGSDDIRWEDNEISAFQASAIFFGGDVQTIAVRGNRVRGPSAATNNSAVGCHPHRVTVTSGWTLVTGTRYSRTVGAQTWKTTVPDVYLVNYNNTTTLNRNTSTPTTPGANEYGFTGGTLYIDVGANPNGSSVTFTYSDTRGLIEGNDIAEQLDSTGQEGRGIQLDDGTSNVQVRGNYVARCLRGIDCNLGTGNLIADNVIDGCFEDGIQAGVNGAKGNLVYHNVIIGVGNANDGIDLGTVGSAANTAKNNVVVGYANGIRGLAASAESYNCIYGATNVRTGGIAAGTGTVTVNPQLDTNYRPQNVALIGAGSFVGGTDFYGRPYRDPPTIGAVEYYDPRGYARAQHERLLATVAELDLDRCTRIYGVAPCTAGRTHTGTAQAGAASTLTLASGASGSDDTYNNQTLRIHTGAGAAQERKITDYVGSTKVATVARPWSSNLLQRSEEFDNAYWGKNDATVTANEVTAPDGTLTGDRLQTTVVTNPKVQNTVITATAQRYTGSVYLRAGNSTAARLQLYQDSPGPGALNQTATVLEGPGSVTVGSATEIAVTGLSPLFWTRIQVVSDGAMTAGNLAWNIKNRSSGAVVGDTIYIWGAQLEAGTAATDYIKTTSAAIAPPDNTSQYHVINRPGACYNTRTTCQDKPNFDRGTHTYKFGLRGQKIPPGELIRPYVARADAAVTVIDPEQGLARRNAIKVEMVDELDGDREQDPYVDDRATPAQGTFWSRLIARNPNSAGRFVRVRRGFVVEPWDWNTFLDELYIVERIDGPAGDGSVAITLKDPIKFTDRGKIPAATDGKITAELKAYAHRGTVAGASSTTVMLDGQASSTDDAYNGMEIVITGSQGEGQRRTITDYVGETRTATVAAWAVQPGTSSTFEVSALSLTLTSGKGSQYADPATSGKREFIRLGEEVIEYTAKSTDTLSWPSSAYREQFGTPRKDHSSGTQVQLCRAFIDQPVTDVIQALLEESGLDASYIDTTALAAAEDDWYGEAFNVTACLSEPESPSDYLGDLLPQIRAVLWWNPQTQKAALAVVLPQLADPVAWTDAASFLEGSVQVDTLEDLRITYAAAYYGLTSATANRREAKSYELGEIVIDTDAESAAEYGDRRAEVVYSRWFTARNEIAMRAFVGRQVAERRDAPRKLSLRLDPKDYTLSVGELVDVSTRRLVDAAGAPKLTRCLVTRVDDRGDHIEVEARTTGFAKRYGFIAPNGTADHPTDTTYAHITQNTGLMTDGSEGYLII